MALNLQKITNGKLYVEIVGKKDKRINFVYDLNTYALKTTKESCVGHHFRIMMEIIESDGDLEMLCWMTACEGAVAAAAIAHCIGSH